MELNKDLIEKMRYLKSKSEWAKTVAKDAGELMYYSEARFLRNSASIADAELKAIESTIKLMEG